MPYYKFSKDDVFYNLIEANPKSIFFIYSGSVFYNNTPFVSGALHSGNVGHMPVGFVSLHEMNVDRPFVFEYNDTITHGADATNRAGTSTDHSTGKVTPGNQQNSLIFPWMSKTGGGEVYKTTLTGAYNTSLYGDTSWVTFKYPLTSSIRRFFYSDGAENKYGHPQKNEAIINEHPETTKVGTAFDTIRDGANDATPTSLYKFDIEKVTIDKIAPRAHHTVEDYNIPTGPPTLGAPDPEGMYVVASSSFIDSLRNTLNHYTKLSPHYYFSSSLIPGCQKNTQTLCMLDIPSIFYGSSIKKGSVDLKWYVSGALLAQLSDPYKNGELRQVSGTYKDAGGTVISGGIAGVVLYNEGIIILTGSWDLAKGMHKENFVESGDDEVVDTWQRPRWIYFGTGMLDTSGSVYDNPGFDRRDNISVPSSSFYLGFEGTTYTPVITMMAHAKKGFLNHSNNRTYLKTNSSRSFNDPRTDTTSGSIIPMIHCGSNAYIQHNEMQIKNIVTSSYSNHTASFEKQTFISKIGIYDENKNLIAIAKMARPIKKTIDKEYTIKMKLDL